MSSGFVKKMRGDVIYIALRFFIFAISKIPRVIGLKIFAIIGRLIFKLNSGDKQRVFENLRFIFKDNKSESEIFDIALKVYVNMAKNIFDAVYLITCSEKIFSNIVQTNDLTVLKKYYDMRRGVIGLTMHLGCFEMISHHIARNGMEVFTIGKKSKDERIDKLIVKMRSQNGVGYLYNTNSARQILKELKSGKIFGVLIDYSTDLEGVFANFLGKLTYTATAPMRIAMKYNIPIFVAYSYRDKNENHQFRVEGPIDFERTEDFERDLVFNMEKVNAILTHAIEDAPEQWLWMIRRWSVRPGDKGQEETVKITNYE